MDDLASDTSTATMDYDASVDRVSSMLGEDLLGPAKEQPQVEPPDKPELAAQPVVEQPAVQPITAYDMPKSWKADMRDYWGKMPREAQEYNIQREKQLLEGFQQFRPIQEALQPHQEFLSRIGAAPAQAVGLLLNAQRRLTEGTLEQRKAAYKELGENLKLLEAVAAQQPDQSQPQIDPAVQSLQSRIDAIERQAQQEYQTKVEAIRAENTKLVDAFFADTKAHPYCDEVADEWAIFIKEGFSLQEAYDRAVRANPAVFAKEQARLLTEEQAKWKENARLNSLSKKKATSVNIKSNGDGAEPTEPLGSIEDTIKDTAKKIRARG